MQPPLEIELRTPKFKLPVLGPLSYNYAFAFVLLRPILLY